MSNEANHMVRIMLVDDHASVRNGLRLLIESRESWKVVGEASDLMGAREIYNSEKPEIVLLDLDLGSESGLDLIPELTNNGARVLVLTGIREQGQHQQCLRLGAMGLIKKEQTSSILLKAIEKVYKGEIWFDRAMINNVLSSILQQKSSKEADPETAKIANLTVRELEVTTLVCEGKKNKQIAERLFITDTTVRHHLTSVFNKLGVADRLELVIYAYKYGLAKPPT